MTYIGSLQGTTGDTSQSGGLYTGGIQGGISGLASGVNTDSIVQGLMQAAQVPLVQLLQQRQITQWKQDSYQRVVNTLTDLQNNLSSLQLQSTFLQNTSSSSNSSLVTATPSGGSADGSYSVAVEQLATGSTISSVSSLSNDVNYANTPLAQLQGNPLGSYSSSQSLTFTLNGENFTVDPQTDTINTVLSQINEDPKAGVTGFYDPNAGKVVLQTDLTGSSAKISVTSDTAGIFSNVFHLTTATKTSTAFSGTTLSQGGTVDINGTQYQFTTGEQLSDVVAAIQSNAATTGVSATLNSNNQIELSSASLYSNISVSDPRSYNDASTVLGFSSTPGTAQNAYFSINGYNTYSQTNQPVFNGTTFNLNGTTPLNPDGTPVPVNVSVSTNVDALVQTITSFVQQYNETLQYMQGQYNSQRNYDYLPLTSAQAAQMTQQQITEWNQKAQAGMLENDDMLGGVMSTLENVVSDTVSGLPSGTNSLASIGITPIDPLNGVSSGATAPGVTTTGFNSYGLLQINTDQLIAAIQSNPSAVMDLFTNPGNGNMTDPSSDTGIGKQLYDAVSNAITQIQEQSGTGDTYDPTSAANLAATSSSSSSDSSLLAYTLIDPNADLTSLFATDGFDTSFLGQQISEYDSQAEDMSSQLSDLQSRYQQEFSNMEQAIAQINSQSSSFLSMMGSGSGSSSG